MTVTCCRCGATAFSPTSVAPTLQDCWTPSRTPTARGWLTPRWPRCAASASFYAARNDDFTPPFTKNMRRVAEYARTRSRVLDDAELRKVWTTAAAEADVYSSFIKVALLCGQRREKVVTMRWTDLSEDGVWTIPTAPREKNTAGRLQLSKACLAIIDAQPRFASSPSSSLARHKDRPIAGFSHRHREFMARCGVDGWTLHDLRRTARSLMSRAGVPSEHAERILGHVIKGVEGIYDRHGYSEEKRIALEKLASLIERIVGGEPGDNVLPLRAPPPL